MLSFSPSLCLHLSPLLGEITSFSTRCRPSSTSLIANVRGVVARRRTSSPVVYLPRHAPRVPPLSSSLVVLVLLCRPPLLFPGSLILLGVYGWVSVLRSEQPHHRLVFLGTLSFCYPFLVQLIYIFLSSQIPKISQIPTFTIFRKWQEKYISI